MIRPVHLPTLPYLSLTALDNRASNESGKRCINAVARITPVPRCFPMKNRRSGICTKPLLLMAGNETATSETAKMLSKTDILAVSLGGSAARYTGALSNVKSKDGIWKQRKGLSQCGALI